MYSCKPHGLQSNPVVIRCCSDRARHDSKLMMRESKRYKTEDKMPTEASAQVVILFERAVPATMHRFFVEFFCLWMLGGCWQDTIGYLSRNLTLALAWT